MTAPPFPRADLPTPALVVDQAALDRNIGRMAAFAAARGVALRPHAKTHKSGEIGRRQLAAGAVGLCCAKLGEAEALAADGIGDLHLTSPVVAAGAIARLVALNGRVALSVVADHPDNVRALDAANAGGGPLAVFVDVDPGNHRTGVASPEAAVALAAEIAAAQSLRLVGVQFYCGSQQHIQSFLERRAAIAERTDYLRTVLDALRAAGHDIRVVTGGGTGTFLIDAELGVLTELQVGSYIFLDREYGDCELAVHDAPVFEPALFVDTMVISANHPGMVTVDAGLKALSTDAGPPVVIGGGRYAFMGDEHGAVMSEGGALPGLGGRVTLQPGHCDPTVNLHDAYHVVEGDMVVAIWPVTARGRSTGRDRFRPGNVILRSAEGDMTSPQITTFAVLGGTMLLFIWGRLRYDLVAILSLLAALATGIVAPHDAFKGFSDDIVIIVGSALVVSAAIERSGLVEALIARLTRGTERIGAQILMLAGSTALLSALVKNIGALAMLMPSALNLARRTHGRSSCLLMPMSFGALLGGLITLVGTSPNIIVSRVREDLSGQPFGMFDYAPVGLGLTVAGLAFLSFGYRLLPANRRAAPTLGETLDIKDYATEARVADDSAARGETVADFLARTGHEVQITGLFRGEERKAIPFPDAVLHPGDLLILEGEPEALERAISKSGLELEGQDRAVVAETPETDIGVIEAVIESNSPLVGMTAARMLLHESHGVNLIAVSRRGERLTDRLRDLKLLPGDVIVLQGPLEILPERLIELGALPLAERRLALGNARQRWLPLLILAAAMISTAAGWVPVAVAFFAAAGLVMLSGALPPREAYDKVEWPILIMIGALIPVSDALRTTGGTDLIAHALSTTAASLPAWGAVALIMAAAMAVTPFLNNAATVLVMAPIAAEFAQGLGYRPEAFLMATAVGAGSDFLTPIGHQCNTLVMGPGGYRFGDYARLGAPLSAIVLLIGVPLILLVWPLR